MELPSRLEMTWKNVQETIDILISVYFALFCHFWGNLMVPKLATSFAGSFLNQSAVKRRSEVGKHVQLTWWDASSEMPVPQVSALDVLQHTVMAVHIRGTAERIKRIIEQKE